MQTLKETIQDYLDGFLSGIYIGEGSIDSMSSKELRKLTSAINSGLEDLYSRFHIKENELVLRMVADLYEYSLTEKHALRLDTDDLKYILDSDADPFLGDVIKVLSVFDEDGCEIPINTRYELNSVFVPENRTIQVPEPVEGTCLYLLYQAKHPKLSQENLEGEIELPTALKSALEYFVAYKYFTSKNGEEATIKANEYYFKYELICQRATDTNAVELSNPSENQKLEQRGFK